MKNPFIIGITGGSGSGKTSIIKLLREKFSESELCLISQDNYYLDRSQQSQDDNGVTNFDLPSCLDEKRFLQDIKSLIAGKAIQFTEYTFNNNLQESRVITIESAPIIVVEGLFVFYYEAMRKLMDLKIYVDASDIVKLKRRIHRDKVERNYPIDDVLYRYEFHVTPAYQDYILPFKRQADIIINNEYKFDSAVAMIEGFIRSRIKA